MESLPGVVIKSKRGDAGAVVGTYNARACGIKLLKSARKVELVRLMRAAEDLPFIRVQQRMRDTATRQPPICPTFLKELRPLSTEDVANDPEWRFAPVGVVSRHERDVVNAAQGGYTLESLKLEDMLRRQGTDSESLGAVEKAILGQSMRVVFLTLTVRDEAAAAGDLPPPRRPGPSIPGV